MTRIIKLEMQGFKSFAKKTVIKFPENFNVICGPNGSGKSNVLDSIVFVLGRTSAKKMRASRMLEMIHNGGKANLESEFAKVALYFDNNKKLFPVEEDEVVVSRRVNRSGVSIYKLNGRTVTREKILEVLRAANVHPDGHNIILQGDITEIIEMSPTERREIIDEISGIMEFDEKKERATRELETVERRLSDSRIILSEREKILSKLETEKESAEKHEKLSRELDILRATFASKKYTEAVEAMSSLEEKIEKKQAEFEELSKNLDVADKSLEEREKSLNELGEKLIDRSMDIEIIRKAENLRSEANLKRGKTEFNNARIKQIDETISHLQMMQQRHLEGAASRGVKEILKLNKQDVHGTIASLSEVNPKYQTAVEVCAGGHLDDLVVETKDAAVECVNYLKKNRIGRATFLPLDKIMERRNEHLKPLLKESGVVGFAIDLIKFDKRYWHAFSFVFGDTVVVDRIETARSLGFGKARFVTLDGDLVERSGAVIGGFYHRDKTRLFDAKDQEKYKKEKAGLMEEMKMLENEITSLEKQLSEILKEEEKGSSKFKDMRKQREALETELEEIRRSRRSIYDKRSVAQEQVSRMNINRARLEADLENIKVEFENYKKIKPYDMDPQTAQAKIKESLAQINSLGAINQKAVEEYREIKVVYDELKGKVDKLEEEKAKVFNMMLEIEGKRKTSFEETMKAVSEQFKKVFHDLTEGEGSLRLETYEEEGEAPTLENSGLVIEASPPGRKVLNIDLMSGGEKTLTALAFLFSIQQFRSVPFYILDEIDAALDRPNTKKITDLIKKYSSLSQFIVITHNDTTMNAADCVYGVSMEDGVSKLVGIKMPE